MPEFSGSRLDVYLAARLHRHSRAKVQGLISAGRVYFRGKPAKPAARVLAGERIIIRYPAGTDAPARHASLEVLYEDEELLAVNKPGDVLSHPTDKAANNSVTVILSKQFPQGRHFLAHRLDRETSGVLLLAKSSTAAARLQEQFAGRRIKKEYWAIVSGNARFKRKIVDAPLGYDEHEIRVRQKVCLGSEGHPAVTHFYALALTEKASLIRAVPKTGRLHQIRAHLAWLGLPILGDKLYMGNGEVYLKAWRKQLQEVDLKALGAKRQMLHARNLKLSHPLSGKQIDITAPIPEDFAECLTLSGLD